MISTFILIFIKGTLAEMEPKQIEDRILELCGEFKNGITYKMIENDIPSIQLTDVVGYINKLLSKNKVDLLKKDDGSLLIKLKDPGSSHRLKGVDPEEQLVFKIIEESRTQGIWAKEIRIKCNLHLNTVDKVLRKLEGKKLVKSFNSISAPKKKRYILYNLEPDRELLGGAWYSEQQFDSEFVDVLNQQCFKFLEQKALKAKQVSGGPIAVQSASLVSSKDVLEYITELGITKVLLRLEEVEAILETLVYDGKVQKSVAGGDDTKLYKAINSFMSTTPLATLPCGVCPLINLCDDVGSITPLNCKYMEDWLEF